MRRRRLNVEPDSLIWIYTKLPRGKIELVGRIEATVSGAPAGLWNTYGARTGLTRAEFFDYLSGCRIGHMILIDNLRELINRPTLAQLRRQSANFQPPQFAKFIESAETLSRVLRLANTTALRSSSK